MRDAEPVTVTGDEGGTVIIETFDEIKNVAVDLIFQRSLNGWVLTVRHPHAGPVLHRMSVSYTQANVLGFMMRAARGDNTP